MLTNLLIFKYWVILFGIVGTSSYCQTRTKSISQLEIEADSLYYNKTDYYKASNYQNLVDFRRQILNRITDTSSTTYKLALSKKHAADALQFQFNAEFDSAIFYSRKAIKAHAQVSNANRFYKGYLEKYLYQQYFFNSDFDNALQFSKQALNTFKDTLVYNHKLVAEAEFDVGFALGRFGDYDNVIKQYKKAIALDVSREGDNSRAAAVHEHHLAIVYGFVGFYKKELESYKKVIKRWESIENKDYSFLSVAYGSLSTWYLLHGDIETAEKYLIKNLSLKEHNAKSSKKLTNEVYKGRAKVGGWLGNAALAIAKGDTIKANNLLDKVLNFANSFDSEDSENNPYNLSYFKNFVDLDHMKALRLKADLVRENQPSLAVELYEKILEVEGKPVVATTTLNEKINIIDYYKDKGDYFTANERLKKYYFIAEEMNSDYSLMRFTAKKAELMAAQKRYDSLDTLYIKVTEMLQKDASQVPNLATINFKDCKPYGDKSIIELVLNGSHNFSASYRDNKTQQDLIKAHNLSQLASNMFSSNFSHLPYNSSSHELVTSLNEGLLSNALLLKDSKTIESALETIERSNSRLSWKKFLASKQRDNFNIPDSILERESDLKASLHFYKKSAFIDAETTSEKRQLYLEKIHDIETEIRRLEEWYNANYPSYFNQTQRAFRVASIKQNLNKNQQIIRYVFAEDSIYAFLIDSKTTELFHIGSKKRLSKRINNLLNALKSINTAEYKDLSKALYQELLPDEMSINQTKEDLIFIQDDILHFLPMEILINAKGKYLIEDHKVSYAPSLLLWEEQLKVEKSKKTKLGIFAPSYKRDKGNSGLIGAEGEASKISRLFSADVFSKEKATKEEFIENAPNYSILHLAMHSQINNTVAEFSNLSFSSKENQKLFISELYNMTLNADLAVLSACNTGSGKLDNGEGLTNVSKAFTYAGVPSIVMSLWEVPDKETSQIMVSFYKHLKDGLSKNKALQLAKLDYLKNTDDPILKHPYYWSGFIISGDVEPLRDYKNKWALWIAFGLLLLALLFGRRLIHYFK